MTKKEMDISRKREKAYIEALTASLKLVNLLIEERDYYRDKADGVPEMAGEKMYERILNKKL